MKSPPELWAECSEAGSLARHLDGFGEIRITRLEPETAVAWEGERASGTVRLEPAGWGTRVTLTVRAGEPGPGAQAQEAPGAGRREEAPDAGRRLAVRTSERPDPSPAAAVAAPAVQPDSPPDAPARPSLGWRLLALFRRQPLARGAGCDVEEASPPESAAAPATAQADPAPAVAAPPRVELLAAALDSLGQAHHRPFSRS